MLRRLIVGLIVLATIGFVVGTTIERHNAHRESAAQLRSESNDAHAAEGARTGESGAEHAAESSATTAPAETHKELHPFGVDIEAVPFVVLAALASLALAALAWLRPRWLPGLAALVIAMIVFGALDVREVFHQSGESKTGLAILAAAVAALHLAAAAVAGAIAARPGA